MSDKPKDDGGHAFPNTVTDNGQLLEAHTGMTLRDYFAAQALVGAVAECGWQGGPWELLAKHAYALADVMLDARKINSKESVS